jgi:hypothetical protein
MKAIYFLLLSVLAATSANAYAAGSVLSVACKGDDVGAEIWVNGKFKGECPLDVKVPAGTLKLKVLKKVDASGDRIFEQDIRVGDGVIKKVDALLGSPMLNAEGKRAKSEHPKTVKTEEKPIEEALKSCSVCPERCRFRVPILRSENTRLHLMNGMPVWMTVAVTDINRRMKNGDVAGNLWLM